MSDSHSTAPVEYRPIAGFMGYRVGSDGTVWTCRIPGKGSRIGSEWRKMSLGAGHNSYRIVGLTIDGEKITRYVQDIVLEAFVGPRPTGMQACHDPDPSPLNNCRDNLRWDTPSGNNADKIKHGTHQIGEKNPRAKLTAGKVLEIRSRIAASESLADIAAAFGVTATLVRLIGQRKCWKHI